MLDRLSSREIAEWRAYSDLEMLPNERLEFLLATLTTVLVNVNLAEDSEPAEIADFLPWLRLNDDEDEEQRMDAEAMVAMIEELNTAFGGVDLRTPPAASTNGDTNPGQGAGQTGTRMSEPE